MRSKVAQLLDRYGYAQEAEPSEYNIRGWHSQQYALPVTVVNGIWVPACSGWIRIKPASDVRQFPVRRVPLTCPQVPFT
ncbi:MAG: hypothetical protein WCD47_09155 [Candidatus Sulfotelmatobacter sp.]